MYNGDGFFPFWLRCKGGPACGGDKRGDKREKEGEKEMRRASERGERGGTMKMICSVNTSGCMHMPAYAHDKGFSLSYAHAGMGHHTVLLPRQRETDR